MSDKINLLQLAIDSAVRGFLYPLYEIRTNSAVRRSLHLPLKNTTKSAVRGFLLSLFKIWTKPTVRGSLDPL